MWWDTQARGGELEGQVELSLNYLILPPFTRVKCISPLFFPISTLGSHVCGCNSSWCLIQSVSFPAHSSFSQFLLAGQPESFKSPAAWKSFHTPTNSTRTSAMYELDCHHTSTVHCDIYRRHLYIVFFSHELRFQKDVYF